MSADTVSAAPTTGNHTIFLSGPAGTGKTTLAVRRLRYLLEQGVPAEQILILLPQRTLATPYEAFLTSPAAPAGGSVDTATIGGLAHRALDIFWPLVSESAGFSQPNRRPLFLTLETAQYHMDRIVEGFVADGAFDGITISRPRLVSQIIDNLNKAAAVGFSLEEIAPRLKAAWGGETARLAIYDQVQAVALAFRRACLADGLLDWSLQIQVFRNHLLPLPQLQRYLLSGFRHLIADNVEEDIPVSHDLVGMWLGQCESALIVHDTDGGYRVFLGADPSGAYALKAHCQRHVELAQTHVSTPEVVALGQALAAPFADMDESANGSQAAPQHKDIDSLQALRMPSVPLRFHPQMLDWVAEKVSRLVQEDGVSPGDIAILAPFLSDSLRFSLTEKLDQFGIPVRTHRPSRLLREEPAARCLLTLAKLAHPVWRRPPPPADVAHCFSQSIAEMDPVRARILADIVYRTKDGRPSLTPFHQIISGMQERISYLLGGRYDELWQWLHGYAPQTDADTSSPRLDHFISQLFGEVLSQPGFGFHTDFDSGGVVANLIESIRKFRLAIGPLTHQDTDSPVDLGREYVDMVERGVVAAQYVSSWGPYPEDAVLLAPAYTFLMANRPVDLQFWLDAGSASWSERIYQPLTHPYVLRRDWSEDRIWADEDEVRVGDQALYRLTLGLSRRCRQRVYLIHSELNERGFEQHGPMLRAVQRLLRSRASGAEAHAAVGDGPGGHSER